MTFRYDSAVLKVEHMDRSRTFYEDWLEIGEPIAVEQLIEGGGLE
ncbi:MULTISPECIES: hypothetical protein [Cohnella]|mgnify:CR=1 FL=1|nr:MULTISPECIES: hypothetical protein [Cohnella]